MADVIPATVRMISGCRDSQTSADVSNVSEFNLPDPAGRSGGACTSALLKVLYANHKKSSKEMSFVDVLMKMRSILGKGSFSQIPQLSSSKQMDIHDTFHIVPSGSSGRRRAVLIGINYVGQQGQLSGCHNDVMNIREYIMDVHGFDDDDIMVLMDDGAHINPTRNNIMAALANLVQQSKDGDSVFFHYSGHGGRLADDDGDEEDGYDETLIPVDFQSAGQIRDDDLFSGFILKLASGVTATCLMDCCHSGTVLDLPFIFKADGESEEMMPNDQFNAVKVAKLAMKFAPLIFALLNGGSRGGNSGQCCTLASALLPLVSSLG